MDWKRAQETRTQCKCGGIYCDVISRFLGYEEDCHGARIKRQLLGHNVMHPSRSCMVVHSKSSTQKCKWTWFDCRKKIQVIPLY